MRRVSRKQFLAACGATMASACAAAPRAGASPDGDAPAAPTWAALHRTGELKRRGEALWQRQERCNLCPRECGARRLAGERGTCGANAALEVAAHHPHHGEERPLSGRNGSGTIFMSHCNLRCVFCINWQISQGGEGRRRTLDELADMMLSLQRQGCHNVNIVTPTHYAPHVLLALDLAAGRGLRLPLVYNTSGWERLDVLRLLDGVVDVYLPDIKYADGAMADRYSSGARSYPAVTRAAVLEMHRQVGVARPGADGLVRRGLMIRHLVMPNGVGGSRDTITWIANHLPQETYLNLMSQYRPEYQARDHPAIARPVTRAEYEDAVAWARRAGLTNLDIQGAGWLSG
jgi:putative pyruvate formate lyase activating enzyme